MTHEHTRFFVVHMQKTAGTTLRDRLRNHFPEAAIYPNRTDGPDKGHAVISVRHLLERWQARGSDIRLLTGHFPLSTIELLDGPFVTLTVLRPPVERTLSYLRHQRKIGKAGPRTPLEEIYADSFRYRALIRNHMVRMLSLTVEEMKEGDGALTEVPYDDARLDMAKAGLERIDLFGLQPHFEEFCSELSARYQLEVGAPMRSNSTEPFDVPTSFADRIAEDNALDMQLYDFACELYAARHDTRTLGS